jgi:hypothetical protein
MVNSEISKRLCNHRAFSALERGGRGGKEEGIGRGEEEGGGGITELLGFINKKAEKDTRIVRCLTFIVYSFLSS